MSNAVNILVNSLFQKNSLNDCTVEELRTFAEKYPYYTGGIFLLAKKMQQSHPAMSAEAEERSSLFFDNKLYFDYLLNDKKAYELQKKTAPGIKEEEMTPALSSHDEVTLTGIPGAGSVLSEEEPVEEEMPGEGDDFIQEERNEEISRILQNATEISKTENAIAFTPYYTVDYFASQGINTKAEDFNPNDRFSTQLKSFTEWLKTLKKITPEEIATLTEGKPEEKVARLAEGSLNEKEVVTETMAEVWLKQGDKAKAIDIYQKLSLLNPPKSAYFASLIEKIKV